MAFVKQFLNSVYFFPLSVVFFSLSEDEAFELCLGLQTLLELKVSFSFALLIFCKSYRVSFGVCFSKNRNQLQLPWNGHMALNKQKGRMRRRNDSRNMSI